MHNSITRRIYLQQKFLLSLLLLLRLLLLLLLRHFLHEKAAKWK